MGGEAISDDMKDEKSKVLSVVAEVLRLVMESGEVGVGVEISVISEKKGSMVDEAGLYVPWMRDVHGLGIGGCTGHFPAISAISTL